ncbi:MAG: hypothetical protein KDB22_20765 [Planctomycetales bacterium]|nr:hypothetical protein [Planctomycetales bacterium]
MGIDVFSDELGMGASYPQSIKSRLRCWCLLATVTALLIQPLQAQPQRDEGFGLGSGVGTGGGIGGYVESAIVRNQIRFRFDAAYGNNKPDRAEYFYAKCGCFRVLGADPAAPGPAPASGPVLIETNVDYQIFQADVEFLLTENLSVIFAAPVRLINPEVNANTGGIGDLQAGFKCALWTTPEDVLTMQLRTYIPTGIAERGLGTNHVSLEPAFLLMHRLSDRLTLESEIKDWIAIGGSSADGTGFAGETRFAGNVLSYGVGLGYDLLNDGKQRVTPVIEAVGWTILDGLSSSSTDGTLGTLLLEKVDGDTIINLKAGARISDSSLGSLYAGWGTALSKEEWYDNILRVEYRYGF